SCRNNLTYLLNLFSDKSYVVHDTDLHVCNHVVFSDKEIKAFETLRDLLYNKFLNFDFSNDEM
ncbi:hypothetical protein, partial [Leyella stercorea]|uniref:hypothetical protein n=1 Tax=Leyella stercorea TaxID=363265 RepID=UPI003A95C3A8